MIAPKFLEAARALWVTIKVGHMGRPFNDEETSQMLAAEFQRMYEAGEEQAVLGVLALQAKGVDVGRMLAGEASAAVERSVPLKDVLRVLREETP